MNVDPLGFGKLAHEKLVARLLSYRHFVGLAARGEILTGEQAAEREAVMARLSMPRFAWRRDVLAAVRMVASSNPHRRAELAIEYPHLFDDADA